MDKLPEGNMGFIALAFGIGNDGDNSANNAIATSLVRIRYDLRCKILNQINEGNGSNAVTGQFCNCPVTTQFDLVRFFQDRNTIISNYVGTEGEYVETKQVLYDNINYLRSRGLNKAAIIGHPHHVMVVKCFVKLGIWKVKDFKLYFPKSPVVIHYNHHDEQNWTNDPVLFLKYLIKLFLSKKHGQA